MNFLNVFKQENYREIFANMVSRQVLKDVFLQGNLTENEDSKVFTHGKNTYTIYQERVDRLCEGDTETTTQWYIWEFEKDYAKEHRSDFIAVL